MIQKIITKINTNLRVYRNDIATKGLYWSFIHRIYKIALLRKLLTPLVNTLKPDYVMVEGLQLYMDKWDTTISQELILSGTWEQFETEIFSKTIKPGDIVVDIGAHIGYYTLLAAKLVGPEGTVYAFEPDPTNFDLLVKSVKANKFRNVIAVKKAVSDKTGQTWLYLNSENTGDHRIFQSHDKRARLPIQTVTLDDYFKSSNVHLNVIKMDIQGAEARALLGSKRVLAKNHRVVLLTEFYPKALQESGISAKEYLSLLKQNEFRLFNMNELDHSLKAISSDQLITAYPPEPEKFTNLLCKR